MNMYEIIIKYGLLTAFMYESDFKLIQINGAW